MTTSKAILFFQLSLLWILFGMVVVVVEGKSTAHTRTAFVVGQSCRQQSLHPNTNHQHSTSGHPCLSHNIIHPSTTTSLLALGDFQIELEKPLGLILEEREVTDNRGSGVRVKEIRSAGSAGSSTIVPGDVLVQIDDTNVENADFETVMDLLTQESAINSVRLTVGDGLGTFDMPKNVVKLLKSEADAYLVDAVVREAVRETRRNGRMGDLIKVEVIVGAGVQQQADASSKGNDDDNGKRVMVRFFAIFSTDTVSTYSCNVAATGIVYPTSDDDNDNTATPRIKIVVLSCAKDEGLGQTFDLITERM